MQTEKRTWPIHPLLFAAFPILGLLASNQGVIPLTQAIRPLVVALAATLILGASLRWATGDWGIASLITSTLLILFFTYGHMHTVLLAVVFLLLERLGAQVSGNLLALWIHPFLVLAWIGLALLARRLIRQAGDRHQDVTRILNLVGVLALAVPAIRIGATELRLRAPPPADSQAETALPPAPSPTKTHPDIYYLVLDGYAGETILDEIYSLDNSAFLRSLEEWGFYVARESQSNYAQTILSIASALNLDYLDPLLEEREVEEVNELIPLLRHSELREVLEREGYEFVAFASGYGRTQIPDADHYLRPRVGATMTLESLLIETTALLVIEDLASVMGCRFPYPGYQAHVERVTYTLDQLPAVAQMPGPQFVFAHILIPHPPFVFGPSGEVLQAKHKYGLRDGSDFQGTHEEYIQGYRDQLIYLNARLIELIPEIVESSEIDPIIVLQGDHGPGARLNWESPAASDLTERFSILNAYRIPGIDPERSLYPTITPVNTFRVILNATFGTELPLLPDRSYFSTTARPLDFSLVP